MSDTESTLEIIKDVPKKSKNWNIVLAAIPILSSIFYALVRFIQYWVEISYLSFWNIPKEFIHKDDQSFVYNFIATISLAILSIFISYSIYQTGISIQKHKHHKFLSIAFFIFVCATMLALIVAVISISLISEADNATLTDAIKVIFKDTGFTALLVILSAGCTLMLNFLGFICSESILSSDTSTKFLQKHKWFIMCVLFFAFTIYSTYSIGSYKIQQYQSTIEFNIIDRQYVVLYKDTETFVVKQCLIDDNIIYIDNDTYQLIDTKDKKIQTIRFKKTGEESVFKRLSAEEFQNLINESNSNEDTPS